MSENGCRHLNNFKTAKGAQHYRIIHSYFVACTSSEGRLRKAQSCLCFVCNEAGPRLHSCLHCIFFGCQGNHMNDHRVAKKHFLSVELTYGFVHCGQCNDYVYDKEFLEIAKDNKIKQARSLNMGLTWRPWFLTTIEVDTLKRFSKKRRISATSTFGLRGMVNLGNTCYMSSIVQTLVHTPMLRAYFFAEKHKCDSMLKDKNPEPCLMCEFSMLFQEFYSGLSIPLIGHRLLHFTWSHVPHLSSNQQQDAHEYFAATLDLLHSHCQRSTPHSVSPRRVPLDSDGTPLPSTRLNKKERCDCIIDQIFTGDLQSDVVCQICENVSTTIDPMRDIAIDFPDNALEPCSLLDCLRSYTSTESGLTVNCDYCLGQMESTKKLSFKSLPVVFSFHLKRFDSQKWKKILKKISFPSEIDMSDFMSKTLPSFQPIDLDPGTRNNNPLETEDNRYSLFAVVNHHGKDYRGGHYTAYVRHYKDFWVKCDDENITMASLSDVLNSEGYLLFYHKHILQYE